MELNRKVVISGVAAIILVVIVTLIVRHNTKETDITSYNPVIASTVHEGSNNWEVYKSYSEQSLIITLNGKIQTVEPFKVAKAEGDITKLPDETNLQGKNITTENEYSKSTWNASLDDAAEQVKWFENAGYTIVVKAETQRFIEVYMKNEKGEYKRILIMPGQLSVADLKEYTFGTINDYVI